ncbi:hypothetical protein I4F81_012778 [Pyropia yezoensis]|uniref:Uncharacterized protein n=1 Tax=Pyropia yezoensis TaxID=2788 RepID=A0ACC3CJ39_PYRYE|nr:hypothetical protein I4F81_012778 [Neopyropia yezoensis]
MPPAASAPTALLPKTATTQPGLSTRCLAKHLLAVEEGARCSCICTAPLPALPSLRHPPPPLASTPLLRPPRPHSPPPPRLHHLRCSEVPPRRRLPEVGDLDYDGAMSGLAFVASTRPTSRPAWADELPVACVMACAGRSVPAVGAVGSTSALFSAGFYAGG